jgi:hypothetical protein
VEDQTTSFYSRQDDQDAQGNHKEPAILHEYILRNLIVIFCFVSVLDVYPEDRCIQERTLLYPCGIDPDANHDFRLSSSTIKVTFTLLENRPPLLT